MVAPVRPDFLPKILRLARDGGGHGTIEAAGRRFLLTLEPIDEIPEGGSMSSFDLEAEMLREGDAGQRRALEAPDMLSLTEAAAQSGIPVRTLTQMRQENRLLALSRPGARRGFRFPAFQFDAQVLDVLPRILAHFGPDRAWQAHDFLTLPEPLLGGAVPIEMIRRARGRKGVLEDVVRAAKAASELSHGAH